MALLSGEDLATLIIKPIESLDAPELELYRTLRRVEEHERAGVFVATNAKVVQRLIASRFAVLSALLTPAWLETLEAALRARRDERAAAILRAAYPGREVVLVDARPLFARGGGIHCITQQQPRPGGRQA